MNAAWVWIQRYFGDLKAVLTQPTAFFRRVPLTDSLSRPLAFALVTHWIGVAIEHLWQAALGGLFATRFEQILKRFETLPEVESLGKGATYQQFRQAFLDWIWGTSSILLDPVWTILGIFWVAIWVYAGARLLITPGRTGANREITFHSAVRIVAYGMTASIFRAVPGVGSLAAAIGTWVLTVIGAREIYRTSTTRAVFVGLFPQMLLLGVFLIALIGFAAIVFGFFAAVLN